MRRTEPCVVIFDRCEMYYASLVTLACRGVYATFQERNTLEHEPGLGYANISR